MATRGWLDVAEAGGMYGLRIMAAVCNRIGRGPARLVLRFVVLYFALFRSSARRASGAYLTRIGRPSGFWATYHHLLHFAECATDRLFFLQRNMRPFEIRETGTEYLVALQEQRRGAILLGAHLGSFEAMRAASDAAKLNIHIVGFFGNARRINALLESQSGNTRTRMVEATPGSFDFVFKIREIIERGEMVAILGDRIIAGDSIEADFLGEPAWFPTGAFALASLLKCPIFLTFGLYSQPNRYDLYCEPFADVIRLPRKTRREALGAYVQQYANRLEHYCRLSPLNWFNFYDFWEKPETRT